MSWLELMSHSPFLSEIVVRSTLAPKDERQEIASCPFPVDIVYTWVDGFDSKWRDKYLAHRQQLPHDAGKYAATAARYISRYELKYSLRSIADFAPWANRIYIVTDEQTPSWLASDHPRIKVVDLSAIIDPQYLPTFNSYAIMANLHKIHGLSEHYVYFSDDMLLCRPVSKNNFFTSDGRLRAFFKKKIIPKTKYRLSMNTTQAATFNARKLLERRFGLTHTYKAAHTILPQRKSVAAKLEKAIADHYPTMMRAKFREKANVDTGSVMHQNLACLWNEGVSSHTTYTQVDAEWQQAILYYSILMKLKGTDLAPTVFCVGCPNWRTSPFDLKRRSDRNLMHFFEEYYPSPSPYEVQKV